MCGIAGILGREGADNRRRRVSAMTRALVHRGPDDEGFFDDEEITLGFRRLAVIDLETGQQPIVDEERRLAIVLNGEIYNFRELREELRQRGHRFRTRGDVEVVLKLWAEEGEACLRRLNGMFALAVWDGQRGTLYLARDRFGIKPLYLCSEGGEFIFASELRALRAGGYPSTPRLDGVQLRHYLAYGYLASYGAPLTGIRSLPPASVLAVNAEGGERLTTYWRPPQAGERGSSWPMCRWGSFSPAVSTRALSAPLRGAASAARCRLSRLASRARRQSPNCRTLERSQNFSIQTTTSS